MSILSITGAIKQISPPPNVKNGKLESNTDIFLFQERENIRLSSPVSVDISSPGDHANKSLTPGTISAGTHVDSYFLHFDRVGSSSNGKRADGSVTFDEEILGVIVKKKNHKETQSILGNPDTSYERTNDSLGLNNNKDRLTWWGNTLTVSLRTTSSLDQVRVITEHSFPTLTSFLLNGRSSNITISEGDSVSASLFARDPNRDTISFILDGSSIGTDLKVSGTRSSNNLRVFRDNGTFTYRAQARDEDGKSSSTITRTVTVNNVAPTITSLTQDFIIRIDKTFSFAATATDPGLADILIYEWDFDGDGEYDDFTGSSGEWSFSEPGDHEVKLRVSDGDGGFDYDSFTVTAEANLVEPYSFRFTDIKGVWSKTVGRIPNPKGPGYRYKARLRGLECITRYT